MNQANTILFLVNPFAGTGKAINAANYAIKIMHQNGFDTELLVSKDLGDLSKFTSLHKIDRISKIAVLGGDGTMFEVVNAIMQNQEWLKVPIVVFPCGTGNSFNHDIGILTVKRAIDLLLNGKIKLLDIAEVQTNGTSIWSFNSVGCGMITYANKLAEKLRWLGTNRYTIAALLTLITKPIINAKITFNDQVHNMEYSLTLACNTRYGGKAMILAPFAKLNDGLIDFVILNKASRLRLLMLLPKVFSGKHIKSPLIKLVQSNHIKVETDTPQIVNIDGEIIGNTPVEIIMFHQILKVVCEL